MLSLHSSSLRSTDPTDLVARWHGLDVPSTDHFRREGGRIQRKGEKKGWEVCEGGRGGGEGGREKGRK